MVTAELALALPVLIFVLALALGVVVTAGARIRVADSAREAARAAARGDDATARSVAVRAGPGTTLTLLRAGGRVTATVRAPVPALRWIAAVTVTATEVAVDESPAANQP